MTENLARIHGSRTAEMTAATRADHFQRGERPLVIEDPLAIHFAGPRWRRILASDFRRFLVRRLVLRRVLPTTTFVLIRARFTDDSMLAAAARGVGQLVLLGAGFDTFALRFPDRGVTVFEVDLEATGALKRERMAAAGLAVPDHLRFVAVDFERDDLGQRLAAAGFDPRRPAFFGWMGVTYYLGGEALRGTLDQLDRLAAGGSELAFDYLAARESVPASDRALYDRTLRFVARVGEPMISAFHPAAVEQELGLTDGWTVEEHAFPAGNRERYLGDRTDLPPVAPFFRLLRLSRREQPAARPAAGARRGG